MISSQKINIATSEGKFYFDAEDIIRLEASSNYTTFYMLNGKKYLTSKVMKKYAPVLETLGFIRTHKTHLVNSRHISAIKKEQIIMRDESVAYISRRMKKSVVESLQSVA